MSLSYLLSLRSFRYLQFVDSTYKMITRRCLSKQVEHISHTIIAEVENTVYLDVIQKCGLAEGANMLLCVSGGSDSVALLHILANIINKRQMHDFKLEIIHFNHKMRIESDEECLFSHWPSLMTSQSTFDIYLSRNEIKLDYNPLHEHGE